MKLVHDFVFPNILTSFIGVELFQILCCLIKLYCYFAIMTIEFENDGEIEKKTTFDNAAGFFLTMRTLKRRSIFSFYKKFREIFIEIINATIFPLISMKFCYSHKKFGKILEISNRQKLREFWGRVRLFPLECPP